MNIIIGIITFGFMEFVAWSAHKYLMHGWLWKLHEDHHSKINQHQPLERNDSFFVIFATPAIILLTLGTLNDLPFGIPIGIGITAYGLCYFLVHDIFIHQRIKWFRNTDNFYLRAIRKAHKMHHKHLGKEDGECFGMLLVPLHYFRNELKRR